MRVEAGQRASPSRWLRPAGGRLVSATKAAQQHVRPLEAV